MGKKKSGMDGAKKAELGDFVVISDDDEENDEALTIYVCDMNTREKIKDATAAGRGKGRKKGGCDI